MSEEVTVAIALIKKKSPYLETQYLVAWRNKNQHQGSCYEFVGGKVHNNEDCFTALQRECQEELAIEIKQAHLLQVIEYQYTDLKVSLHCYQVDSYCGDPVGAEGQRVAWVSASTLLSLVMPEANNPLKRLSLLPTYYFISRAMNVYENLEQWLLYYTEKLPAHALFYIRDHHIEADNYMDVLKSLSAKRPDLALILPYRFKKELLSYQQIRGFHLTYKDLTVLQAQDLRQNNTDQKILYISSCHDESSIQLATNLGVDAITLSPIKPIKTQPNFSPLGWQKFGELTQKNIPVYGLGGVSYEDLAEIRKFGGHGLAGVSMLD